MSEFKNSQRARPYLHRNRKEDSHRLNSSSKFYKIASPHKPSSIHRHQTHQPIPVCNFPEASFHYIGGEILHFVLLVVSNLVGLTVFTVEDDMEFVISRNV